MGVAGHPHFSQGVASATPLVGLGWPNQPHKVIRQQKKMFDRFWPATPKGQNQSIFFLAMGWPNHPPATPIVTKVGGSATPLFFSYFFFIFYFNNF
jgi:hypothetical protein